MRLWPLLLASCAAAPQPHAPDLDRAGPQHSPGDASKQSMVISEGAGDSALTSPTPNISGAIPEPGTILAALESTATKILAAAVAPWSHARVVGSAKAVHGKTHCAVAPWLGVLPMVWPSNAEPLVGVEWRCEWTTLALGASRDWPAVVLASVQDTETPPSVDLTAFGLAGCWLHVDLGKVLWLWPGPQGSMVYRPTGDEGRVAMNWTPTADYVGRTVMAQLVVVVPRDVAASGMLLSPGLSVTVGRR